MWHKAGCLGLVPLRPRTHERDCGEGDFGVLVWMP